MFRLFKFGAALVPLIVASGAILVACTSSGGDLRYSSSLLVEDVISCVSRPSNIGKRISVVLDLRNYNDVVRLSPVRGLDNYVLVDNLGREYFAVEVKPALLPHGMPWVEPENSTSLTANFVVIDTASTLKLRYYAPFGRTREHDSELLSEFALNCVDITTDRSGSWQLGSAFCVRHGPRLSVTFELTNVGEFNNYLPSEVDNNYAVLDHDGREYFATRVNDTAGFLEPIIPGEDVVVTATFDVPPGADNLNFRLRSAENAPYLSNIPLMLCSKNSTTNVSGDWRIDSISSILITDMDASLNLNWECVARGCPDRLDFRLRRASLRFPPIYSDSTPLTQPYANYLALLDENGREYYHDYVSPSICSNDIGLCASDGVAVFQNPPLSTSDLLLVFKGGFSAPEIYFELED